MQRSLTIFALTICLSTTANAQQKLCNLSAGFQTKNQTYGLGVGFQFFKPLNTDVVIAPFSLDLHNEQPTSFYGLKFIYNPIEITLNKFILEPYLSSTNGNLHYSKASKYPRIVKYNYFTNDACLGAELKLHKIGFSIEVGRGWVSYSPSFWCINFGLKYHFKESYKGSGL